MTQAQTKLITGELKYALLNEPGSSMALVNGKKNGAKLYRVLDISEEWARLTGKKDVKIPWAWFAKMMSVDWTEFRWLPDAPLATMV